MMPSLTTLVLMCVLSFAAVFGERVCFGTDPNCQFPAADCREGNPSAANTPPVCEVAGTAPIPTWSTFVKNVDNTYTLSVFSDPTCTQQVFTSTTTEGVCTQVEVPLIGAQFYQVTITAASLTTSAAVSSASSVVESPVITGNVRPSSGTVLPTATVDPTSTGGDNVGNVQPSTTLDPSAASVTHLSVFATVALAVAAVVLSM